MEIDPFAARLRMLQQVDAVRMQREATPDAETAGCPGCPYFWTCPVPHRGEEVRAPREVGRDEVIEALGPRRAFTPRDESDIGWTDEWVDEDGLHIDPDELAPEPEDTEFEGPGPEGTELENTEPDGAEPQDPEPEAAPSTRSARRARRRGLFRRR